MDKRPLGKGEQMRHKKRDNIVGINRKNNVFDPNIRNTMSSIWVLENNFLFFSMFFYLILVALKAVYGTVSELLAGEVSGLLW